MKSRIQAKIESLANSTILKVSIKSITRLSKPKLTKTKVEHHSYPTYILY